jgi:DNA repair protein RecN (Recombination protein N)
MLTCLRVKDLAIVDTLELELGPGLTVLTGETGAGKSILVDALELVVGARSRPELVRSGRDAAEVEALFDLEDVPEVRARIRAAGFEVGDELVVRRIVRAGGRSRAYVDGRLASQRQLASLVRGLATISSQHEHHGLTEARQQLELLDAFAGADAARGEMRDAHDAYALATDALADFRRRAEGRAEREDFLRYLLREIDEVAPEPEEDVRLSEEHDRLAHADHLMRVTDSTEEELLAGDDSIGGALARLSDTLSQAARHDARLGEWATQLDEARAQIEDVANEAGAYARRAPADPARLAWLDERVAQLRHLARKHGGTIDAVLKRRDEAREELGLLGRREAHAEELEQAVAEAEAEARQKARALHRLRTRATKRLARAVTRELESLGMAQASFEIALHEAPLGSTGADRAELVVAPNAGEAALPLSKVASGGELSRVLLAIKRVLSDRQAGGLHVFDEIDTGVGGIVAERVGRKLKEVAKDRQVVCITHLPQVAVFADAHFHVEKSIEDGRTVSRVTALDGRARLDALARMLGGARFTKKTRAAAAELLEQATAA